MQLNALQLKARRVVAIESTKHNNPTDKSEGLDELESNLAAQLLVLAGQ